jgi:hypothetical protein
MSGSPFSPSTTEDLGTAYAKAQQDTEDAAVAQEMFDAFDQESDVGSAYANAAQKAEDDALLQEMEDEAAEYDRQAKVTTKPPANVEVDTLVPGPRPVPGPAFGEDVFSDVANVGGDLATGFAMSGHSVVGGVRDAVNELAGAIDGAGAYLAIQTAHGLGMEGRAKEIEQAQAEGQTTISDRLPEIAPERSATGGLIRGVTQFVTGFATGGKVLKTAGFIGKNATTASVFLKSAFSDAFAFDPAQQRLSNLVEEVPELKNPLTEFLASKPGDSEAAGRFKNALEGLGLGAALTGVFATSVQGLRALNALKPEVRAETVATHVREGLKPMGSPDAPAFTTRKPAAVGEVAPEGLVSAGKNPAGNEVFINFARVEAPDDIKTLLQKAANTFSSDISAAQRGVQSFEATKSLADDMGMEVKDLISRRVGPNGARTPFTAEEALAARRLYTASGTKLMELAQKAAGPNAGEIDHFNLHKMMAIHQAVQMEVIGARTETARALASWRIPAGSGEQQLRSIEQLMESIPKGDTRRLAAELVKMQNAGVRPGALGQFVRKSSVGTFMQGVREVYVNGFLSGPLTHIVNAVGNLGTLGLSVVERQVARGISHATGSEAIVSGEARAMMHGMLEAQRDALRLAWKATGDAPVDFMGKVDSPRRAAIRSAKHAGFDWRNNAFGTLVNILGATTRAPGLLMGASDQYFKAVHYRAGLHAYSLRQAANEGHQGKALNARVAEIVSNPPDHLQLQASDTAFYNTFNSSMGEWGRALMKLREAGGSLNPIFLIAPFIRTPVNIARYSFERTPLAPLVGQWRADIAAGGARRDIALAKMATGTMFMGMAQIGAEHGYVSGARPKDQGEGALWDREGRQAYSVKIGDTWYSYNRLDPFGMVMGFAADMQNTLSKGDIAPEDVDEWQEIMAGGVAAISQTALDKTTMRGFSQFSDMLSDPERYGVKEINSLISGFVPFSSLGGAVSRGYDPTIREVHTPLDAIANKIPTLAERMIPSRDLWGQARTSASGLGTAYDALSPFKARQETGSPIDAELDRLRVYPKGIGWKAPVAGVTVNFAEFPQVLDQFRRLAGNELKHPAWGKGLKDFLDETVSGKGPMSDVYRIYSDGEQGGKQAFIKDWINKYRDMAAREILNDPANAAFRAYYEETKAAEGSARQRVNLQ